MLGEMLPGEGVKAQIAGATGVRELGVDFGEGNAAAETIDFVDAADEDRRRTGEARMAYEKTREFSAGIAGDAEDGGLNEGEL